MSNSNEQPTIMDDEDPDDVDISSRSDDSEPAGGETDGDSEQTDEETVDLDDVEEASVDLDAAPTGGDLFDGVESAETDAQSDSVPDESEESGGEPDAPEQPLDGIETAIVEGAARLGVTGLGDDDFEDGSRDELQEEFEEIFEAFRLGHFGARTIDEYVLQPADGEVDPAWGLMGSTLLAACLVVWMRPDGDEQVGELYDAIDGMTEELL